MPRLVGVGPTQVTLLLDDRSIHLIDYNLSESQLDRQVTTAIRDTLRSRLDAEITFEKERTSHSCFFGP